MKSWERSSPAAVYYLGKSARESQRTAQDSDRIRICIHSDLLSQLEHHVSFLGWMAFTLFASFVQSALYFSFPPHSATIGTSTWHKHYCMYTKENKILTMIPYTQTQAGRLVSFAPDYIPIPEFILLGPSQPWSISCTCWYPENSRCLQSNKSLLNWLLYFVPFVDFLWCWMYYTVLWPARRQGWEFPPPPPPPKKKIKKKTTKLCLQGFVCAVHHGWEGH